MKIAILGGGIGGLTTAIALSQAGHDVSVYESAPAWKPLGAGIVLAANAMRIYASLGLLTPLLNQGNRLSQFRICDESGMLLTEMNPEVSFPHLAPLYQVTIHRAELHRILLQTAPKVHLGRTGVSCRETPDGVTLTFSDGTTATANLLIAADGIHSAIRRQFVPGSEPQYAGYFCWRAVLDASAITYDPLIAVETWGCNGRFGIVPLQNNRLYVYACVNTPKDERPSFEDVTKTFERYHAPVPDIARLMKQASVIESPITDIKPLDHWVFGRVILLGDAAHATTPNMGQGACQAIEDAYVLATLIGEPDGLRRYEQARQRRTAWISDQSRQLGLMSQLENPLLIRLRNGLLRLAPPSLALRQMKRLLEPVSF